LEKKTYNRFNFHKHTFCEFIEQDIASISALQIHYKSKSGSSYSYTEEGVYRSSNHWGRASNCRWRLVSSSSSKINNFKNRVGFAKWSDFYPNNETEKLFYIEVNFDTKEVIFQHKNNPNYYGTAVLRNASETAKVIRQIKEILEYDTWAKYLDVSDLEMVRNEIIQKLITTNIPLPTIKKTFY
jgi:hypothetical protein